MTVLNTLLEITIYSAVLFGAIWLFRTLLKKQLSAAMLYALWFILIARLLIPVTITSGFSFYTVQPVEQPAAYSESVDLTGLLENTDVPNASAPYNAVHTPQQEVLNEQLDQNTALQSAITSSPTNQLNISWEMALTVLWLSGIVVMLMQIGISVLQLRKRIKTAQTVPLQWQRIAEDLQSELGFKRNIRIVMIERFPSPALCGGVKPIIVLPSEMTDKSEESIRFALLHEMTHIKRGDQIVSMLLLFLRSVYWFNPVVWMMMKQMRLDIEMACDSHLTGPMSTASKKRYAGTMLSMYAQQQVRCVLGMSLGQTKKTAERRLRGVFMRSRTSRVGKTFAIMLTTILLVTCFTTACQPIPAESNIAQTDVSSSESMGQQDTTETLPELVKQEQKFTVPDTWQDEITQDSTDNTIIVDAEVICPEFDSIDTVSIYPKDFTQQEVDELITYFVGDGALYNGGYRETKEILYDRIVETQSIMAMTQEQRDAEFGGVTEEELQKELEDLQARYAAAPDEEVKTAVTSELTTNQNGYEILDIYADFGGSNDMLIEVLNYAEETFNASFQICLRYQSNDGKICDYDGEPEEVAQAVLDDLGISDVQFRDTMMVAASNHPYNTKINARVRYERSIGGIPIRAVCPLIDASVEYTAPNWRGETISFDVSEKGLTCVKWSSHAEIGSTIEENVSLLSFEEITEIFKESILLQPFWGKRKHCTYHITNVTLCMVPVAKEDGSGEYMLVPAWNFYGYQDQQDLAEFNPNYNESSYSAYCLMTISAEDGTILYR